MVQSKGEIKLEAIVILHYTYTKFSHLTSIRVIGVVASLQKKKLKDALYWTLTDLYRERIVWTVD
ncbi:hypothetical protein Fmac_011265 [Flemingia macrophylla]|uniref:Uncharacterized protein n=1 Tax=Flemingia macrophylla TaxID=520843 RepID=A0ABD1MLY1_9FABA